MDKLDKETVNCLVYQYLIDECQNAAKAFKQDKKPKLLPSESPGLLNILNNSGYLCKKRKIIYNPDISTNEPDAKKQNTNQSTTISNGKLNGKLNSKEAESSESSDEEEEVKKTPATKLVNQSAKAQINEVKNVSSINKKRKAASSSSESSSDEEEVKKAPASKTPLKPVAKVAPAQSAKKDFDSDSDSESSDDEKPAPRNLKLNNVQKPTVVAKSNVKPIAKKDESSSDSDSSEDEKTVKKGNLQMLINFI